MQLWLLLSFWNRREEVLRALLTHCDSHEDAPLGDVEFCTRTSYDSVPQTQLRMMLLFVVSLLSEYLRIISVVKVGVLKLFSCDSVQQ